VRRPIARREPDADKISNFARCADVNRFSDLEQFGGSVLSILAKLGILTSWSRVDNMLASYIGVFSSLW
jgi:hypothetical protein